MTLEKLRAAKIFDTQWTTEWFIERRRKTSQQSEWFRSLSTDGESLTEAFIREIAEVSILSVLTLIDGVAGPYERAFEIVAIDADDKRTVIDPENSEMLHDVFSEICEEER